MKKAIILIPTYNEKDNITPLIQAILRLQKKVKNYKLHILVIDDSSPDGTGKLVQKMTPKNKTIHILNGKKQGLGAAYIKGFKHAIKALKADVLFEMDADFSHNPNKIPHMLKELDNGYDLVIGSRYIKGGKIPKQWSYLRKANSKWGNLFARHIADIKQVHDCTGGYRAIKKSIIKNIDMDTLQVKGYAFQVSLLTKALEQGASIKEIPINFIDRKKGQSKIQISDIAEFIIYAFKVRLSIIQKTIMQASIAKNQQNQYKWRINHD